MEEEELTIWRKTHYQKDQVRKPVKQDQQQMMTPRQ